MQNNELVRYKTGVVLSGGGAKGFAHIGALRALRNSGIVPDIISGVSSGAILGALYCDGYDLDEITDICAKESFTSLAEFTIPKSGIMTLNGLKKFLEKHLRAKTFEELKTPLVVTATNFDLCCTEFFSTGNLVDVICASSCIPVVFEPWIIDGTHYVDGGVLSNLPVIPIRKMCQRVIGINATTHLSPDYKKSIFSITDRTFRLMLKANSYLEKELCDLYIESEEEQYFNIFSLDNIKEISEIGFKATQKALESSLLFTSKRTIDETH